MIAGVLWYAVGEKAKKSKKIIEAVVWIFVLIGVLLVALGGYAIGMAWL